MDINIFFSFSLFMGWSSEVESEVLNYAVSGEGGSDRN
jgi:hypothetical protein